ncbi:multidrug ABC transporter permease [Gluconacetobacter johannae DSM 13595]|uniref:ABC transporter permease n=1 Tax=Gluconacetobacter johannae TaxID=112140 RepID=A0A7W4P539_9PROT|nr:ABC transporter permease [Gluconacetobacter johannae]MBB2177494.1 ABC transporter permease [Gluconacetobacter johannae]GBQ90285.1 multidrug ABC transporter permease [Gluconacetobacter johannae DSM 13595]
MTAFSLRRLRALLHKEWLQVKRDPMTLRLIVALPVMQLLIFGYAINSNPHDLPTGVLMAQPSTYERTIVAALRNSGYYRVRTLSSEREAEEGLAQGNLLFVVNVPPGFDRRVDRGEAPAILIDTDGTDPTAIGYATAALGGLTEVLTRDLPPVRRAAATAAAAPFRFVVHTRYNPEQLTVLNVVPGLICVVLMMSTLMLTTLAITRERERGTMENLLAMPVRPIEVMLAKIAPYVGIGYLQVLIILLVAVGLLHLPIHGSIVLLFAVLGLFIASNLALGITYSTLAANQMQAQQLAQFTMLPFMLLSGFAFPFQGMPRWARIVGEIMPTTHAMRIVRGVLLKGNGMAQILPELWPIALFTGCTVVIAVRFYRETLD